MSARDTSGSAPQHSHPHNNTMSYIENFWVDQVTVPHPPLGNDKGWGTTRGGGGYGLLAGGIHFGHFADQNPPLTPLSVPYAMDICAPAPTSPTPALQGTNWAVRGVGVPICWCT